MKVSLVIPTWNGGALLGELLERLECQPGAADLERVAIDSGSRDATVALLRRHGFKVHAIAQHEFNHGATRDRAIELCRGDLIVLLTQDAVPADARWLPELLASYADPSVGAAYCRQVPRVDCNPLIEQRLREWAGGRVVPRVQQIRDQAEYDALAPLERLHRCAFDNVASSVRRSTWQKHRFGWRAFGEDVAFGKRVLFGGGKIVFQARSMVIHSHNRTPREEGRRIYCDHQNLRELFGVHLMPTRESFRGAVQWGQREFPAVVDRLGLRTAEAAALRRWALEYALWSAAGIYLGGNSAENLAGRRAKHYQCVDRWMHRGI